MQIKYYDDNLIKSIRYELHGTNIEKAGMLIEEYENLYPDDVLGKVYEADYLRRKGMIKDALEVIESLSGKFYSKYSKLVYYEVYSTILDKEGRIDEAEKILKEAFKYGERDTSTTVTLTNFYIRHKEFDKASSILDKSNGDKEEVLLLKAKLLFEERKNRESNEILNLIDDNKLNKNCLDQKNIYLAANYYYMREYELSKKYLLKVNSRRNDFMSMKNYYLTMISCKFGKIYDAEKYLQNLSKMNIKENVIDLLSFRILLKEGKLEEARKLAEKAYQKDGYKLNEFGYIDYVEGNYEDAIKYFSKTLSLDDSNFSNGVIGILLCYARMKKFDNLKTVLAYTENDLDKRKHGNIIRLLKSYVDGLNNTKRSRDNMKYAEGQMYEYSEEDAIKHIYSHHSNDFENMEELEKAYKMARKLINDGNIDEKTLLDKHIIKVGNENICAVTVPDSNKIITMYKVGENEKDEYDEEPKKHVLKRESQIDKFRKKYGNKY